MDQAEGEVVLLEAVEATAHAAPEPARFGCEPEARAHGIAEPQGLLADEPDRDCAIRAEQPLAGGTRSSGHESHLDGSSLRASGPSLIGTALYGAVRRVVWDRGANYSPGPDWASYSSSSICDARFREKDSITLPET